MQLRSRRQHFLLLPRRLLQVPVGVRGKPGPCDFCVCGCCYKVTPGLVPGLVTPARWLGSRLIAITVANVANVAIVATVIFDDDVVMQG